MVAGVVDRRRSARRSARGGIAKATGIHACGAVNARSGAAGDGATVGDRYGRGRIATGGARGQANTTGIYSGKAEDAVASAG